MSKKEEKRNVVFRRIGGRIVPITIGTAAAAKTYDLARTQTVYQTKDIRIDRKKLKGLPIAMSSEKKLVFGEGLYAYNNKGKYLGRTLYGVEGKEGSFDWLSVKKSARGQGVSKKLTKQAAIEMKGQGATKIFSHVVHKRSAGLFEGSKVKSKYYRGAYTHPKTGEVTLEPIGKRAAMDKVTKWQKPLPYLESIKEQLRPKNLAKTIKQTWSGSSKKSDYGGPTVFREVTIPKNIRRLRKPFRTTGNKVGMAVYGALAIGSLAYGLRYER